MASCKDCLSCKVCYRTQVEGIPECTEIRDCPHFKDHNSFVELPYKVKNLIDTIICHNEIVGIWERRKNKEGRYSVLLWRGMAWDIPEKYLDRTFLKIFGTVPKSITEADTVNIAVTPILISKEEVKQALKEVKTMANYECSTCDYCDKNRKQGSKVYKAEEVENGLQKH